MGGFERKIAQKQTCPSAAHSRPYWSICTNGTSRPRPAGACLRNAAKHSQRGGGSVVRRRVLRDGELQGRRAEDESDKPSGSRVSLSSFPFKLDAFQAEAGRAIGEGDSVLVTAPTGSGKTVIGEMAIRMALEGGKRAIYTTPIKALSNQKFLELQTLFGRDNVGLITGDVKYQSQASVLVMTTEILRNILYKELGRQSQAPQSLEGNVDFSQVQAVVLDEVHYLGDKERGSVWEEVIIYLPKHVQMICLSATLPNAEEVVGWLRQVHGRTELVSCSKRPVPLTLYWTLFDPEKRWTNLEPVFRVDSRGDSVVMSKYMQSLSHLKEPPPSFRGMLMALLKQKKLPAIWFIFKRRSCDIAAVKANKILRSSNMLKAHERASLFQMIQELRAQSPESVKEELVQPFLSGIASHHAGLLPAWKGLVEQGFQAGLIKLVFATHTLAMGINMPAKTTVISDLEMKRGPGLRGLLTHNDIMQLSGRAGRRGYDKYGNCILMNSPSVNLNRVIRNLQKGSNPITSSFKADYGMVLNLLDSMGAEAGKDLMKSSFLNYQCQLKGMVMEQHKTEERTDTETDHPPAPPRIRKAQENIAAQGRILSVLLEQTLALRKECIEALFYNEEEERDDRLPCLVALDCNGNCIGQGDGSNLQLSLLFDTVTDEVDSKRYFLCLDQDKRLHKVSGDHIGSIGGKIEEGTKLHQLVEKIKSSSSIEVDKVAWEEHGEGLLSASCAEVEAWREMEMLQSSLKNQLASVGVDFETEMRISEQRGVLSDLDNQLERLKREYEEDNQEAAASSHDGGTADEYYQQIKQWLGKRDQKFGDRFELGEEKNEESDVWHVQLQDKTTGIVIDCEDAFQANARREAHRRMLDLLRSSELYEKVVNEFDSRVRVLCEYEALDRETMSLLPLGHVAAQIHSENQLWMAVAATSEQIYMLDPKQLAGFVCALVTKESLRLQNNTECSLPASERVYSSLESLEPEWERLTELQIMNGISQTPFIDARLAGLAEQWAAGCGWHAVKESVPIDEGDIVKILHRTQDMLRQFASLSHVPSELTKTARIASDLFERSPLTDA